MMSSKSESKRIDWAKYCDFKYRRNKADLVKLCSKLPASRLNKIFTTQDETGLSPIHWAAAHNRSDFIEFMADSGCQLRVRCRNNLFANGTALHLAAMNGCIEAAAMLIRKAANKTANQTRPKTFVTLGLDSAVEEKVQKSQETKDEDENENLLSDRDSEGQTALMRTAAPRSKRLDIVRDLLRKNLWSLNGRPGETALFLINKGANWRDTDSYYDVDLVNIPVSIEGRQKAAEGKTQENEKVERQTEASADLVSVDLSNGNQISPSSSPSSDTDSDASSLPLISMEERTRRITSGGLKPLQLAIIYGRLSVISLLWQKGRDEESAGETGAIGGQANGKSGGQIDSARMRSIMWRALWANKSELIKFARVCLLRGLLVIDLIILTLVCVPAMLISNDDVSLLILILKNGPFVLALCLTLLAGYRVMSKDPGHLRRRTEAYLAEMRSLVGRPVSTKSFRKEGTEQRDMPATEVKQDRRIETRVRLLCHKCKCLRKSRSRHCNQCRYCVQDFDHHCIYLGCCIGRKNRLDFLVLMLLVALTGIYGAFVQQISLDSYSRRQFWHVCTLIWMIKYIIIGSLCSFFILKRACEGVTMFESMRSSRIRRIFGSNGPPGEINKSHEIYSIRGDSYWRYSPDRFVTGELSLQQMKANLIEFGQLSSPDDYIISLLGPTESWRKEYMYKNV